MAINTITTNGAFLTFFFFSVLKNYALRLFPGNEFNLAHF